MPPIQNQLEIFRIIFVSLSNTKGAREVNAMNNKNSMNQTSNQSSNQSSNQKTSNQSSNNQYSSKK